MNRGFDFWALEFNSTNCVKSLFSTFVIRNDQTIELKSEKRKFRTLAARHSFEMIPALKSMHFKTVLFCQSKLLRRHSKHWKTVRRLLSTEAEVKHSLRKWQTVIGLEIHGQIHSQSKLFSRANTTYFSPPNTNVAFFDYALPGTLPVINRRCVEAAVITGLALNCSISEKCTFDRKHYFYADMPAGYQITQYRNPIATNGFIDFIVSNGHNFLNAYPKRVPLKQIQLEQDSGKSLRDTKYNRSLVDLNRAGIGLMEFVFDPVINSAEEAVSLVRELSLILRRIDTCTCKMAEGVLRVDVNISVHKPGEPLGIRCEVKNLNSLRAVFEAIEYEALRQINILENGGSVINETRMYDSRNRETVPMRDKEVMQDYRFMPEPNLPPVVIKKCSNETEENPNIVVIDNLKKVIPRLPTEERSFLQQNYKLSLENVYRLVEVEGFCDCFARLIADKPSREANSLAIFMLNELLTSLQDYNKKISHCNLNDTSIGDCFDLMSGGVITSATTKDVLNILLQGDKRSAIEIVNNNRWQCLSEEEKRNVCLEAIEKKKHFADRYKKKGQKYALQRLLMYVATVSANRISEEDARIILSELLQPSKKEDKS